QVLLARVGGQALTEPALAGAEAVVRGGVEVPDAGLPGGAHRAVGLLVGGGPVEVAELGGAEAEPRQLRHRAGRGAGSAGRAAGAHAVPSVAGSAGSSHTGRIPESSPP